MFYPFTSCSARYSDVHVNRSFVFVSKSCNTTRHLRLLPHLRCTFDRCFLDFLSYFFCFVFWRQSPWKRGEYWMSARQFHSGNWQWNFLIFRIFSSYQFCSYLLYFISLRCSMFWQWYIYYTVSHSENDFSLRESGSVGYQHVTSCRNDVMVVSICLKLPIEVIRLAWCLAVLAVRKNRRIVSCSSAGLMIKCSWVDLGIKERVGRKTEFFLRLNHQ